MPLTNDVKGIEKDQSFSMDFCKFCYENGAFRNPDLTIEDQANWLVEMAISKMNRKSVIQIIHQQNHVFSLY